MIKTSFSITEFTQIKNVGKEGHLHLSNDDETLIMRKDHTPIFLVRMKDKLEFYELDNLTQYEKKVIDSFYEFTLMQYLPKMDEKLKSITAMVMLTGIADYRYIFSTTMFKNGEVLVA